MGATAPVRVNNNLSFQQKFPGGSNPPGKAVLFVVFSTAAGAAGAGAGATAGIRAADALFTLSLLLYYIHGGKSDYKRHGDYYYYLNKIHNQTLSATLGAMDSAAILLRLITLTATIPRM